MSLNVFDNIILATQLLDMVEKNEINKPLLALLDENIAGARKANQVKEAELQISY